MESVNVIPGRVNIGHAEEKAPYKIRQAGIYWWTTVIILAGVVGFGVYSYMQQFLYGDYVTGLRDVGTGGGAGWGIYISILVYFVGVSFAGVSTAALVRLFNLKVLKPLSRMAEALTVFSLPMAALAVMADLGQPERALVNLTKYVRPQAPFFGTFTLVISGYLFSSLVFLFLSGRADAALCAKQPSKLQWFYKMWASGYTDTPEERERHSKVTWWLSLTILPLLVVAHSTLGFIFGIQGGRPGWYSALMAPAFVTLAGVSGIGFVIIIAAIVRSTLGLKKEINEEAFKFLANMLWVLCAVYLYFTVAEFLTANYAAPGHEAAVSQALYSGQYAPIFWTAVGLLFATFVSLLIQFMRHRIYLPHVVAAGVAVNIAAFAKRFIIVVPSQTVGTVLPYVKGYYWPTWVEWGVVAGLFGLATLIYVVFVKVFPIMEVSEHE